MEIKEIKEIKDGKIIAVDATDKEVVIDLTETMRNLSSVNAESASRRIRLKEVETELEELKRFKSEAENKNNDESEIEKNEIVKSYKSKIEEKENLLQANDQLIRKLLIGNEFARSDYFSGTSKKTILTPDIAESYFGQNFKVSDGKIVAYRQDKTPIMSKENPENYAGFGEAIDVLISEYPNRDSILTAPAGGDGMKKSEAGGNISNVRKLSDLKNAKEKSDYIKDYGLDAFKKLVK